MLVCLVVVTITAVAVLFVVQDRGLVACVRSYVAKDIVAEYKKFDNDPSKFLTHIGKHSRTGEVRLHAISGAAVDLSPALASSLTLRPYTSRCRSCHCSCCSGS